MKSDGGLADPCVTGTAALQVLLLDPVRQLEARGRLRDILTGSPTTMTYLRWLRRLPRAEAARPVAVLSSFTSETLTPFLEVEAYISGWWPRLEFVQYGQWQNALRDPEVLRGWPFHACTLLLHSEELLPLGAESSAAGIEVLSTGLRAFRETHSMPVFLGIFPDPPGIGGLPYGDTMSRGRTAEMNKLNAAIVSVVRELADMHVLDIPACTGRIGDAWHDRSTFLKNLSLVSHRAMPLVAREIARALACLFRPRRKLLALDLDNTLWGGIVGEDGVDGLEIDNEWPGSAYLSFQRQLRALRSSGILLALDSKNNEADAKEVFRSRSEMVLSWDDFSARRVNWQDKATNLVEIAEELGLGLDSFVFADDNPMECALVRETLPQVEVVELGADPSRFMERILQTQAFDTLSLSQEDTQRAESYRAESRRREFQSATTSLESFLSRSELGMVIRPGEEQTLNRIQQLTSKTNQFNISLERLSMAQVRELAAAGSVFTATLSDRFGDYGLIGVLYFRDGEGVFELRNLLMSCRALGRNVEGAMLAFAGEVARFRGYEVMETRYVKGPRNQQIKDFLKKVGFEFLVEDNSSVRCALQLKEGTLPWPPYIQVDYPKPGES